MLGGTMKTNRSAQSTVRRVALFWTLSLITVGSVALGAVLAGPAAIGPAVFGVGALLLLAVLGQELRPVRGHAYRASLAARPEVVAAGEAPMQVATARAPRRRVSPRRVRLVKAGC